MPDEKLVVDLALIASVLVRLILLLDGVEIAVGVDESGEGKSVGGVLVLKVGDFGREGENGDGLGDG
jgi:hypothetical protein